MLVSKEQEQFIEKKKKEKRKIRFIQIIIVISFLVFWEYASLKKWINPFIFSSPSRIGKTLINLIQTNNLWPHIIITVKETLLAFGLGILLGFSLATLLYEFPKFSKIVDPFLTIINSLPKVALGPIIIIWAGANIHSVITMALLINLIVTTISVYNGFMNTDENKIKLLKSFGANPTQILTKLIFPSSFETIISTLKLNISMSLIGT